MPIEILIYPKSFNAKCIYNDGMCVYAYEDNILYTRREGFIIRKFVYFFFIVCKVGIKGAKKKKPLRFVDFQISIEKKREREREKSSRGLSMKKKNGGNRSNTLARKRQTERKERKREAFMFSTVIVHGIAYGRLRSITAAAIYLALYAEATISWLLL